MQKCAVDALLPPGCVNASLTPEQCLSEEACSYLFHLWNLSDVTVGVILIVVSIVILCAALIGMVKFLTSLLQGKVVILFNLSFYRPPCGSRSRSHFVTQSLSQ